MAQVKKDILKKDTKRVLTSPFRLIRFLFGTLWGMAILAMIAGGASVCTTMIGVISIFIPDEPVFWEALALGPLGMMGAAVVGLFFRYWVREPMVGPLVLRDQFHVDRWEKDKEDIRNLKDVIRLRKLSLEVFNTIMVPVGITMAWIALIYGPFNHPLAFLMFAGPLIYGIWVFADRRYISHDKEGEDAAPEE